MTDIRADHAVQAAEEEKALKIEATPDGTALVSSDVEGARVALEVLEDGSGVRVTEMLPDGEIGQSTVIRSQIAAKPAETEAG